MQTQEQTIFQLILHGGNGRSYAMEAIAAAKQGEFAEARRMLERAGAELQAAHELQTSLLQQEAGGQSTVVTLLMVHAQDHLMTAMAVKELAFEFIELYERITP
ncbi:MULTISPECIES: PTS lactose/cellobiose transporter subunit IIA [Geobacillus]|uniref:PTS lactose/cellobiose transporter subunit IIA n=1 Tax=Geobacillus TaxID=129337 RepID=UPI0009C04A69|nr:PTS lactose/cellobiose transporter subunit IIA [Geobacillus sp. 46C-IIa]OQP08103.1 PTS lactose/cellobiose transporter subunit IIA [Geobacillus sp. 46C-IIa]QNU26738.1 PTS lactose/cellobiose transporter subunit IIA [Geobacillus sp. 46C-IIa]